MYVIGILLLYNSNAKYVVVQVILLNEQFRWDFGVRCYVSVRHSVFFFLFFSLIWEFVINGNDVHSTLDQWKSKRCPNQTSNRNGFKSNTIYELKPSNSSPNQFVCFFVCLFLCWCQVFKSNWPTEILNFIKKDMCIYLSKNWFTLTHLWLCCVLHYHEHHQITKFNYYFSVIIRDWLKCFLLNGILRARIYISANLP